MQISFSNLVKFLFLAIASFSLAINVSAQRYYNNHHSYYSAPRVYAYAPRPVFRPSLSVNLGLGSNYYSPYYRPYIPYGPSIGFRINVLPFGYYPFSFGNGYYYYYDNTFYRRYDDRNYEVVTPPIGAKLPQLPRNAKAITIDGIRYYELGGTYYAETYNERNQILYEVVGINGQLNTNPNNNPNYNNPNNNIPNYNNPNNNNSNNTPNNNNPNNNPNPTYNKAPQDGDIISTLPDQSRTVTVNGQTLYISPDNIYYQQIIDGNKTAYKVVGK